MDRLLSEKAVITALQNRISESITECIKSVSSVIVADQKKDCGLCIHNHSSICGNCRDYDEFEVEQPVDKPKHCWDCENQQTYHCAICKDKSQFKLKQEKKCVTCRHLDTFLCVDCKAEDKWESKEELKEKRVNDDILMSILKRMWNCRGKKTLTIDKVKMEQILREELSGVYTCQTSNILEDRYEYGPDGNLYKMSISNTVDDQDCDNYKVQLKFLSSPGEHNKVLQKPLACRNARCQAMCDSAFAEVWAKNPEKCPNYERELTDQEEELRRYCRENKLVLLEIEQLDSLIDRANAHKSGEWISINSETDKSIYCLRYLCSECGYVHGVATRYCPGCGAKMSKEGKLIQ